MKSFFHFVIHHPIFPQLLRSYFVSIVGAYSFLGIIYAFQLMGWNIGEKRIMNMLVFGTVLAFGSTCLFILFWIKRYRFEMDSKKRLDEHLGLK